MSSENRAMLLTPPGSGAIAVVRLIGPGIDSFLSRHFSRNPQPGRCVHGILRDESGVIDDPVIVRGEGFIDINLHGGEWIIRQCLELAQREGFEIAYEVGPFLDASDEIERDMLAALSQARTAQGIRLLLDQPARWRQWLSDSNHASQREILEDRSLWWMLNPPRVAIVGIPNAGKSTLANQLFGQKLSITADVPGTTRDWVGDWANLDGLPIMLLDTPGQRQSDDSIEQLAIQQSRTQIERADLVILVLDATAPLLPEQDRIRSQLDNPICVINKVDRTTAWEISRLKAIHTVAVTGQGIDALRTAIRERFIGNGDPARLMWWTDRQRQMLERFESNPALLIEQLLDNPRQPNDAE